MPIETPVEHNEIAKRCAVSSRKARSPNPLNEHGSRSHQRPVPPKRCAGAVRPFWAFNANPGATSFLYQVRPVTSLAYPLTRGDRDARIQGNDSCVEPFRPAAKRISSDACTSDILGLTVSWGTLRCRRGY